MRAARFSAVGQPIAIEDVPVPRPRAGEVLLDVVAAGVCGTELHFLDGLLTPAKAPITLGHEVAGTVAEVGDGVTGLATGDRVAVHYFHACGRCRQCRRGRDHLCDAPLGFLAFVNDGGFAEQVVVPASALVPIPAGLSFAEAAPLCCSATTALHATRLSGLGLGDTAVVYGCGGVGLALVQVLRATGTRVLAVSRTPEKLHLARELGADVAVDAAAGRVAEQVREATAGAGADAVFELVGTADTGAEALGSLGKGGALVYVGYSFDSVRVEPLALVVPEQRVLTSVGNTHAELEEVLELAARGLLRPVVHETAPLEEVERVLDDLRAGRVVGRSVLLP